MFYKSEISITSDVIRNLIDSNSYKGFLLNTFEKMYQEIGQKKFYEDFQRGFNPLYPITSRNNQEGSNVYELTLHIVDGDKAQEAFKLLRNLFDTSLEEDRDKIRKIMEILI